MLLKTGFGVCGELGICTFPISQPDSIKEVGDAKEKDIYR
jgi:hypothetical protein